LLRLFAFLPLYYFSPLFPPSLKYNAYNSSGYFIFAMNSLLFSISFCLCIRCGYLVLFITNKLRSCRQFIDRTGWWIGFYPAFGLVLYMVLWRFYSFYVGFWGFCLGFMTRYWLFNEMFDGFDLMA